MAISWGLSPTLNPKDKDKDNDNDNGNSNCRIFRCAADDKQEGKGKQRERQPTVCDKAAKDRPLGCDASYDPCDKLCHELVEAKPEVGYFAGRDWITDGGIAIVEEIRV
jgi:hypothetical protein